ncbi:MAG: endonuclease III [Alphaproteobacteria bacterium]
MKKEKIAAIFERLSQGNPTPETELNYENNYTLLVAVALSAQATDISVNKATKSLFIQANTPQKMLHLGEVGLKEYIKTIGLYNTKAKNVIKLSQDLLEKHNGIVPHDRAALEALPGVGRKTANVVLSIAFGEDTIAVDTHVFRVSNRLGLAKGKTPLAVETELMKNIPEPWIKHAHHWLILQGRYVCKARKPDCTNCVLLDLCEYSEKTSETV